MRRLLTPLLAVLLLVGCGDDGDKPKDTAPKRPPVTIGTKNFGEQFLLGELYAQSLRSRGFRIVLKKDIGSTEIIHRALRRGTLDLYPEYIGVLATELAGEKRPDSARMAYLKAKTFEEDAGFTLLRRTPFENRDALAVRADFARREKLSSIPDLAQAGRAISVAGPPEFRTRFEGLVGLREVYGLSNVEFKPMPIGEQYDALESRKVDAADVFTTDGRLTRGRFRVLLDPKNVFGFQNVAPVVSRRVLEVQGPGFARTVNSVSSLLTTEVMRRMNAAVERGQDPESVADEFLRANSLK